MTNEEKKSDYKTVLLDRLHDPVQLRVLTTGLILVIGYVGISNTFGSHIDEANRKQKKEDKRVDLARDVEYLRDGYQRFEERLPKDTDANEWVEYVIEAVRNSPLMLQQLESETPERLGPYKVVLLSIQLSGTSKDLDAFLHWLETDHRLFRVNSATITPSRDDAGKLLMKLEVMGMMG